MEFTSVVTRRWPPTRTGRPAQTIGLIGSSGPAAATDAGAAIRAAAKQFVPIGPRRAGPMSAAHSGKSARIDFIKTGFAATGPEHERSECGGTERCCVLLRSARVPELGSHTEPSPSHPLHTNVPLPPAGPAGRLSPGAFGGRRVCWFCRSCSVQGAAEGSLRLLAATCRKIG
jgi:hypothetical protein